MLDVVIVGGGAAGLSAGLVLGRFRRKVLICDSGQPRNARATGVHNFLSRDGIHPQELLQIARDQLKPYDSVEFRSQEIAEIIRNEGYFDVVFADGSRDSAKKILLATGVKDQLPPIEGLEALWGTGVFHCPYCHGWEVRDKAIAVLANGDAAVHLSKLLFSLSTDIVICTNGESEISDADAQRLAELGIGLYTSAILKLEWHGDTLEGITFADGRYLARDAIFLHSAQSQHSGLPAQLGCAFTENGLVQVDILGKTSVEGVYAAGDLTSRMQQVVTAAATGASAAAGINTELAHEAFVGKVPA
jgi:thioredoxin reductase